MKIWYNFKSNGSVNGFRCLYNYFFLHGFRRISTSSSSNEGNTSSSSSSFANFLVDKLGFSNDQSLSTSATLASRRESGQANWVKNANSVVQFFTQIGFQQSDIRIIVCHEPLILVSRVSKTLKPKIKLLNDIGLFGSDLVETVVWNPSMLRQRLGPAIDAFRTILGSDQNVVRVMKRSGWIQFDKASYYLIPNAELLQSYCGISGKKIQKYIIHQPGVFSMKTDLFRKNLIRVEKKLGIPRDSKMFFYGIQSVAICSDKNIDDKCEIFRSFGWTQSNVKDLIRRHPLCLTLKEEIIKEKLDFLINQLGYKPACPAFQSLFSCSIEKRLLPRHRVLQVLKEKRLIKKHYRLSGASILTEAHFLKKFVLPFEEVHEVYAQLTGSTVESLIVKGQTLKMRSRSNAASCKSAHKLAGVRRCSKHGPLTGRRHVTGSCWNWSIVLTFHLLEYCMFPLIVSQYIG